MLYRYNPMDPKMIPSVVCFTDILGFSQMVLEAHRNGTGSQLLRKLHRILTKQYEQLRPSEDYIGILKSFTDNIVIGLPVYEDGESQLGSILHDFTTFQLELTLENFFVRGGVAIGDYYGDDEFAYGPSIIEAHTLESKIAKNPRIILADKAVTMVKQYLNYYAEPEYSPQSRGILQDNTDGMWFINYLDAVLENYYLYSDFNRAISLLLNHKKIIELNLKLYQDDTKVFPKYIWVAEYHNYFCTINIPKQLIQDHELIIPQQNIGDFSKIV